MGKLIRCDGPSCNEEITQSNSTEISLWLQLEPVGYWNNMTMKFFHSYDCLMRYAAEEINNE